MIIQSAKLLNLFRFHTYYLNIAFCNEQKNTFKLLEKNS
jgi:hypothetical protein